MISKPKVTLYQRRGASAENEIKERLSHFAIPMKPEIDVGIDFYCQLLEGDLPSSRFFGVQTKGTKHFNGYCYRRIKRSTINLWLQSPFPVFLVVYDVNSRNCYWMSIVHNLNNLIGKLRSNNKTIGFKIGKSNVLEKGEDKNHDFIVKVKEAHTLMSIIRGRPQFGEGYVRTRPMVRISQPIINNLKDGIRDNLNLLITNYLLENDIERAYFLCDFLTKFDRSHYDHFLVFGRINKLLGKKKEARKCFQEAIKICKRDKKWNILKDPEHPRIERIIALIEREIDNLKED